MARNSMNYQANLAIPGSGPGSLSRRTRQFSGIENFNRMRNRFRRQGTSNKMEDVVPASEFRANRKGFKGHRKTKQLNKEKLDQDLNTYFAKDPEMYKKMLDDQLNQIMEDTSNQA
jgi:hypothetical protein